jgi:hypothetical protein
MKTSNQRCYNIAFLWIAPVLFIFLRKGVKIYLPLLLICVLMAGCFRHYYKIDSKDKVSPEMISILESTDKIYFVHFNNTIYSLQKMQIVGPDIEAEVEPVTDNLISKAYTRKNTSMKYKPNSEGSILLHVHLYVNNNKQSFLTENSTKVIIPITSIIQMDVYDEDKKRTKTNMTFSSLGLGLSILTGILIVLFNMAY